MLELRHVAQSFGGQDVLRDVSFLIRPGERAALVGPNGTGKSTILKIAAGLLSPERGMVIGTPRLTISYLPQLVTGDRDVPLWDEMESVFAPVQVIEQRLAKVGDELERGPEGEARLRELIDEQARLHHELDIHQPETIPSRIGETLAGLGFVAEDYPKPLRTFSGGWLMRAALARLLLEEPNVLLLDEPTNHLDLVATEWLEERLRLYRGAFVVVSHDRFFLDRVTNRTLAVEDGTILDYPVNYSAFAKARTAEKEAQERARQRQDDYFEKQMATVNRFRASATRAKQAKSREQMLAKIERIEAPPSEQAIRVQFPPSPPSANDVVQARNVTRAYGERVVLDGVSFRIGRGDRVGLVGPNGAGKSTLLRILARVDRPDSGQVQVGENVRSSYYAQDQADQLNVSHSVFDEAQISAPPGATQTWLRSLLARFLFRQESVFKIIGTLSGGERSRLALAKLLLRPSNLLLLDEPTNHLDLASREALEEALLDYGGTIVLASHDRYLLDRLCTHIVEVGNGEARLLEGNYSHVRDSAGNRAGSSILALLSDEDRPVGRATIPSSQPPSNSPSLARLERELGGEARPRSKSLEKEAARRQKQAEQLETMIARLETRLVELTEELASPVLYGDPQRSLELLGEYGRVETELSAKTAEWEKIA